jgi:site-specific DNA-cytosine methylase
LRLTHGSCFAGIAGFDEGFRKAGWDTIWQSEIEPFCRAVLRTRFPEAHLLGDIRSIALRRASPVRMSRSRAKEQESLAHVQDSFTSLRESLSSFDPLGFCSRMFPDFSVLTGEETLQKSSGFSWSSAGMGFRGACLTANFSESPNVASVCSLLDVLEDHVPLRFYLSPRACRGVLRRAEKRKRILLPRLQAALGFVGSLQDEEWKMITTWLFSPPAQATTGTHPTEEMVARLLRRVQERESARLLPQPTKDTTKIPTPSSPHLSTEHGPKEGQGKATIQLELLQQRLTQMMGENGDQTNGSGSKRQSSSLKLSAPKALDGEEQTTTPIWLVRRLTPTECETLQGFPKGWTVPDTEVLVMQSQSKSSSGSRKGSKR